MIGGDTGAGGGGAGGPGSPLLYSTATQQFNPPAPGATMASIRAEIKAKQDLKPQPDLGRVLAEANEIQDSYEFAITSLSEHAQIES